MIPGEEQDAVVRAIVNRPAGRLAGTIEATGQTGNDVVSGGSDGPCDALKASKAC